MIARGIVATLTLLSALPSFAGSQTRTSGFEYDSVSGLLIKEIIEPDNSALCLVTTYHYDAYGNRDITDTRNCSVTGDPTGVDTVGEAPAPTGDPFFTMRTSSATYAAGSILIGGITYNWSAGQFATSTANALNQYESRVFDPRFAGVASLTGPNSITTNWTYDSFGRKSSELRADGTTTSWFYERCVDVPGQCPSFGTAQYRVRVTTTGAPATSTYYDSLNRQIRTETQGFDGRLVWKDTHYDSLGRVAQVSRPYYYNETVYLTVIQYDLLGRVAQVDEPSVTSGPNTGQMRTVTAYNNVVTATTWTTTVTVSNAGTANDMPAALPLNNTPQTQTKATTRNSQGQVIKVTDTQGNKVSYTYDPLGNLTTTTDTLGNVTTLSYDLRGRKIQTIDPDQGNWTYHYNALGELIWQCDPVSRALQSVNGDCADTVATRSVRDVLGRMTSRTERDLVSTWTYDNCTKGIGKVCQASTTNGFSRTNTYDSLGRPWTLNTTIDAPYGVTTTYVASGPNIGKVDTITYPTGFAVKNTYNAFGYLLTVQRADAGGSTVFWTTNAKDASGRVTSELLGNNLTQTRGYDPVDRLTSVIASGGAGTVHGFSYTYDTVGNVLTRADNFDVVNESFAYDNLNRLFMASGTNSLGGLDTRSFGYDAIGNMTYKSDAGIYTYPASGANSVHPHAVASVTGTLNANYTYDANGNLLSGGGRTLAYMSFNMPATIVGSAATYAYTYNPDHERAKLVTTLATGTQTSIYLHPGGGGALFYEKEIHVDGTVENKHYVQAGSILVGVYVTKSAYASGDGPQMRYYHRDSLGSIMAISNDAGAIMERLAYEAYGKRRYPNGTADPSCGLFGITTDRGFTAHEHLDELCLIHMNGRVYDPTLGRFMTPDSAIQTPDNLQSYNRYSYVFNNPLAYTDPSGYFSLKRAVGLALREQSPTTPKNTFDAIHAQPGQEKVDKYVMNHPWAYVVGQVAATTFTAWCGGCGGAIWAAYYTYEATGSQNKAVYVGALTYLADNAGDYLGSPVAGVAVKAVASVEIARIMGGDDTLALKRSLGWGGLGLAIDVYNGSYGDYGSDGKAVYKADPTMQDDPLTQAFVALKCISYDVCGPKNVGNATYAPIDQPWLIGEPVDPSPLGTHEGSPFMSWVEKNVPFLKETSWSHDRAMGQMVRGIFGGKETALFTNLISRPSIPLFFTVELTARAPTWLETGRDIRAP